MIDKFVHSMADAMTGIGDGSTILLGGFGDVGIPTPLLDGLIAQGARDLTIVAVAGGRDGSAIERLLSLGRVRKLICSFVRPASLAGAPVPDAARSRWRSCRRARWRNACAPPAPASPASTRPPAPTRCSPKAAKRARSAAELCLLEYPLPGDVALIEAWSADRWGNLTLSRQRAELQSGHGDGRHAHHRA